MSSQDFGYFYCVYDLQEESVSLIDGVTITQNLETIESGALVTISIEGDEGYEEHSLILLGWGLTSEKAKSHGEDYYRQVARRDGIDNVSQAHFSQIIEDTYDSDSTQCSEADCILEERKEEN